MRKLGLKNERVLIISTLCTPGGIGTLISVYFTLLHFNVIR